MRGWLSAATAKADDPSNGTTARSKWLVKDVVASAAGPVETEWPPQTVGQGTAARSQRDRPPLVPLRNGEQRPPGRRRTVAKVRECQLGGYVFCPLSRTGLSKARTFTERRMSSTH